MGYRILRCWVYLLPFLFSCSITVRDLAREDYLEVNCPSTLQAKGFYCREDRAYSNKVQTGSRVRVESLLTGKSITVAVYRREDMEGICVPERFRGMLGPEPFPARLEIQRCGVDDRRRCPIVLRGLTSYYGEGYHGGKTPYGIEYDMYKPYAASPDLPLGTLLRVRNLRNGKEVVVKIVDRGPLKGGRILDLSYASAKELDMIRDGVVEVEARVLRCGD
ncbi:MAG: septal ring lytic transglycosylase RlpA family protein [Aquificaceae bacterium]